MADYYEIKISCSRCSATITLTKIAINSFGDFRLEAKCGKCGISTTKDTTHSELIKEQQDIEVGTAVDWSEVDLETVNIRGTIQ